MAVKGSGVGLFTIPTAPSVGTNVATTAANTYSLVYVTMQTSGVLGALFIPKISVTVTSSLKPTYCNVQIATGASGSESIVGQIQISGFNTPVAAAGITQGGTVNIWPPIPVAANVRIAAKVADSVSPLTWSLSLQATLQTNVVAEGTINETVNCIQVNSTNLTARDIGASVLLSSGTGTGQLAITSGVAQADVRQLLGTAWLTPGVAGTPDVNAKLIGGTSQTGRDIGASVLLSSGTGTGQVQLSSGLVRAESVSGAVGSVTGLTASNLDATISSRMATYTQPTGFLTTTFPSSVAGLTNITAGTITTVSGNVTGSVGSVTGLTASNLDATISSRMATYVQPTGFLTTTFPSSVAGLTNITAGTITTVSGNVSGNVVGSVGSVTGLTASNLDATVSSRLATTAYTAPDNASVTAIKAKTDSLAFTVAGKVDSNVHVVNGVTVTGTGTTVDPWGP